MCENDPTEISSVLDGEERPLMERVAFWGRKSNSEMSKGGGLADGHLMHQPNAAAVIYEDNIHPSYLAYTFFL